MISPVNIPSTVPPQHEYAVVSGAECWRCPLLGSGRGPVHPTIPDQMDVLVIAEAPGHTEVEQGRTLVGASGKEIRQALTNAGADMARVGYSNAILCQPEGDMKRYLQAVKKAGHPSPIDCCRPRVQRELEQVKFAILMGGASLQAVGVAGSILSLRGTPVQIPDGPMAVPIPHAAFVMRDEGATFRPIFHADVKKAIRISRGGNTWVEPRYFVARSADEIANFLAVERPFLAVDTETDAIDPWTCGLRRIGIGTAQEVLIYAPLSVRGHQLLDADTTQACTRAFAAYFQQQHSLVFHNYWGFDSIVLNQHRMPVRDENVFDCYQDNETEFLTENGWRRYDAIDDKTRLASFDAAGEIRFELPTGRVKKRHYGDMLTFDGIRTRSVVTPTHRMWCRRENTWDFVLADDLVSEISGRADFRVAFEPSDHGDRLAGDFASFPGSRDAEELIGLFLTDGNIIWDQRKGRKKKVSGIAITQAVDGLATPILRRLQRHFDLVPYTYKRKDRKRTYQVWHLRDPAVGAWAMQACGRYSTSRRLPAGFLELDVARRKRLFAAMLAGDSHMSGTTRVYSSASKRMAGELQALALSVGVPCTLWRTKTGIYNVQLRPDAKRAANMFVRLYSRRHVTGKRRNCNVTRRRMDTDVVCFSVPSGRLVTRSRGRAAFHGNSFVAHSIGVTSELPHRLDFLGSIYTDAPFWKNDVKHSNVHSDDVLDKYLSFDVAVTHASTPYVSQNLQATQQEHVYRTDTEMWRAGRSMSALGIRIDRDMQFKFASEYQEKADRLTREFVEMAGRDVNPNSVQQVKKLLYEDLGLPILEQHVTGTGEASTDEQTLLDLLGLGVDKRAEKIIHALLGVREAEKVLGTNTGRIENGVLVGGPPLHADGRLRTTWRPGKVTGRWGSSQPVNMMNVQKKLRAMYRPSPGNKFVAADMSAVELRVLALLSGDQPMIDAFNAFDAGTGPDVHTINACAIFRCTKEQVTDEIRTFCKRVIFGAAYGAQASKIYQTLSLMRDDNLKPLFAHITLPEVERVLITWWSQHPSISAWQKKLIHSRRSCGYIASPWHKRKRYFIGGENQQEEVNYPIQGGAADLQNGAVGALVTAFPFDYVNHRGLVLQVHDQLVVECRENEVEYVKQLVEWCMTKRIDGLLFPAKAKAADDWKAVS